MPSKSNLFVLDTSALLSMHENEPGADEVERILRQAGPKGLVFASFISLMEFYYITMQERGETEARHSYLELKQLPLEIIQSDEELGLAAGCIKALYKLSLADAWIAATAKLMCATLVHKDPEFEQLQNQIKLQHLPYKPGS